MASKQYLSVFGIVLFVLLSLPILRSFSSNSLLGQFSDSLGVGATAPGNIGIGTTLPPDTQPPTAPTNLTATAINESQINLMWTESTDNVGVAGYAIFRNATQAATVSATNYTDTGLSVATTYSYFVQAFDAAGNFSASSNTAVATTPDLTAPTVTITNPTNGSTIRHNSIVTITATASDNVAVSRVEFAVNGSLLCSDTLAPYSCAWNVAPKPQTYTIQATAFDTATNSASHTITVISR